MGTSIRWTTRMRALLRRWQGAPLTWLIAGGFVLMVAMAIGTALTVDRFRQNAIESGRDSLENSVRMLARHFDREFADFAVLQKSVIAELESHGITSADIFRSEMATLAMHEVLRAKASGWSDVAGANVFELRYARTARPADTIPGSKDRRELAIQLDSVKVVDLSNSGEEDGQSPDESEQL